MKKVDELVYKEVPHNFYFESVGGGMCGNCFLTEDGRLYKEFVDGTDFGEKYETMKYISKTFKGDHLVLPDTFVFLDRRSKELVGYLRDYIKGEPLDNLPKDTDVRKFILAYAKLEKEMVENIKFGLEYNDLHPGNILYTPNDELKVIDQELYGISYENVRHVFIDAMFDLYFIAKCSILSSYKEGNAKVDEIVKKAYYAGDRNFVRPSIMLELLVEHLEKEYAYNIKDCNDLDMGLKLSKGV